jgi:TonB family protein
MVKFPYASCGRPLHAITPIDLQSFKKYSMKILLIVTLLISMQLTCLSQNIKTEFYTKEWQKVDNNGYYKRQIMQVNDSLYEVKDFAKGKRLEMVGYLISITPEIEHGTFEFYNKKGQLIRKETFSNGEIIGKSKFYSKGILKETKVDYNFKYEIEKSSKSLLDQKPVTSTMRDSMPNFKGGDIELRKYIATSITYPYLAWKYKKQGRVLVNFMVSDEGKVFNVKVVESIYKDLDKEAVRIIRNSPDWVAPKLKDGKPASFTLPIFFALY